MGKVKIAKKNAFIDMTPMSDVMVLLLTFFMLTSTFVKPEPVQVLTPQSTSEIKVPDTDVLSILVDKEGKVFMSLDNQGYLRAAFEDMCSQYGVSVTGEEIGKFYRAPMFGVPMNTLGSYLKLSEQDMNKALAEYGIPTDSVDGGLSEFQNWVKVIKTTYVDLAPDADLKIAIKADANTPYKVISKIMTELQDIRENRYYLLTSLKKDDGK